MTLYDLNEYLNPIYSKIIEMLNFNENDDDNLKETYVSVTGLNKTFQKLEYNGLNCEENAEIDEIIKGLDGIASKYNNDIE